MFQTPLEFYERQDRVDRPEITFEISEKGAKAEIRFTHLGLVPQVECFNACSNAWGFYINGSLRSLIATGKGQR